MRAIIGVFFIQFQYVFRDPGLGLQDKDLVVLFEGLPKMRNLAILDLMRMRIPPNHCPFPTSFLLYIKFSYAEAHSVSFLINQRYYPFQEEHNDM